MENVWSIILLVSVLIYEFVVSPKICKRKIIRHINSMSAEVIWIERLTRKEFLYSVDYRLDGKVEKAIVQFNILFHDTWRW